MYILMISVFHVQTVRRPLPGPSDADRAGEFSFGRLELGGPTSSRFSAIVDIFSGGLLKWVIIVNLTTGKLFYQPESSRLAH